VAMKADAVPLLELVLSALKHQRLARHTEVDPAYDPGHGWAQYPRVAGRRASGFVPVAQCLVNQVTNTSSASGESTRRRSIRHSLPAWHSRVAATA
jgi:hypothetical protein